MAEAQRKREKYLNWADYFMGIALLSGQRSKDPHTQVGACIVNEDNRIVGTGYNGFPDGCSDDEFSWAKNTEDAKDSKSMYVVHAELNAVLNRFACGQKNCTMYVTLFPCCECAKAIIQSRFIKEIVYMADEKADKDEVKASKRMLDNVNIKYVPYKPTAKNLTLNFHDFRGQNLEL